MSTEFAVGDIVKIKTWDELVKNDANIPDCYRQYAKKLCRIHEIEDPPNPRYMMCLFGEKDPIEEYFITGDFDLVPLSFYSENLGDIAIVPASQVSDPIAGTRLELKHHA